MANKTDEFIKAVKSAITNGIENQYVLADMGAQFDIEYRSALAIVYAVLGI